MSRIANNFTITLFTECQLNSATKKVLKQNVGVLHIFVGGVDINLMLLLQETIIYRVSVTCNHAIYHAVNLLKSSSRVPDQIECKKNDKLWQLKHWSQMSKPSSRQFRHMLFI